MKIHTLTDEVIEFDNTEMKQILEASYPTGDHFDNGESAISYIKSQCNDPTINDASVIHFAKFGESLAPYVPDTILTLLDPVKFKHIYDTLSPIGTLFTDKKIRGRFMKRLPYRTYRVDLSGMDVVYEPNKLSKENMVSLTDGIQDTTDYTVYRQYLGMSNSRTTAKFPGMLPRAIRRYKKKFGKLVTGYNFTFYNKDKSDILIQFMGETMIPRPSELQYVLQYTDGKFSIAGDTFPKYHTSYTTVIPKEKLPVVTDDQIVTVEPNTQFSYYFYQPMDTMPVVYAIFVDNNGQIIQAVNYFDLFINNEKVDDGGQYVTITLDGHHLFKTSTGSITYKRKNPLISYRCDVYDLYSGKRIPFTNTNGVNLSGPDNFTLNISMRDQIKAWHTRVNTPTTEYETNVDELTMNTDLLVVFREKDLSNSTLNVTIDTSDIDAKLPTFDKYRMGYFGENMGRTDKVGGDNVVYNGSMTIKRYDPATDRFVLYRPSISLAELYENHVEYRFKYTIYYNDDMTTPIKSVPLGVYGLTPEFLHYIYTNRIKNNQGIIGMVRPNTDDISQIKTNKESRVTYIKSNIIPPNIDLERPITIKVTADRFIDTPSAINSQYNLILNPDGTLNTDYSLIETYWNYNRVERNVYNDIGSVGPVFTAAGSSTYEHPFLSNTRLAVSKTCKQDMEYIIYDLATGERLTGYLASQLTGDKNASGNSILDFVYRDLTKQGKHRHLLFVFQLKE